MTKPFFKIAVLAWAVSVPATHAQICNINMAKTTVEGRFIKDEQGYVIDAANKLIWDICSIGQIYASGQCVGTPTEFNTWKEALQFAAAKDGYRMPNIKELETIVERACIEPSIDQDSFPDTPLAIYWSNTPAPTSSSLKGYVIDFTDGSEIVRDVNRPKNLRLIKETLPSN